MGWTALQFADAECQVCVCVCVLHVYVFELVCMREKERERGERFCVFLWVGVCVCVFVCARACALGPDLCIADADNPFDGGRALRRKDAATGMTPTTTNQLTNMRLLGILFTKKESKSSTE